MATSSFAGFNAKVYISTDGGNNYDAIGEMRDATLTLNQEEIDATSFDSSGWMEHITGLKSWEISCEGLYVYSNTGQTNVENSLLTPATVKFRFLPKTGSGNKGYQGDGIITNYEVQESVSDAAMLSISIMGTGALTTYTAS